MSSDDSLLYAADTDNGILAVVDVRTRLKVAEVRVGALPERVAVAPDDTIYVANRGDRSVSVIHRGAWSEAARIDVGVEPSGLAVSPDGRTLYVVNATSLEDARTGTLQAVDTASLQTRWTLPVGEEPRGLALVDAGRAAIALHKQGAVVMVDLERGVLIRQSGRDLLAGLNRTLGSGIGATAAPTGAGFRPRALADIVASPDGERLYVTGMLSSDAVLGGDATGGQSAYGGGPCNASGVASPGLLTFNAADVSALADDVSGCSANGSGGEDFPPTLLTPPPGQAPVQGPGMIVPDASGTWLFVANRETDSVAIVPTARAMSSQSGALGPLAGSARGVVAVGAAPNGLALTRDGRRAFVYSPFDHTITELAGEDGNVRRVGEPIVVAGEVLTAEAAAGRRLFFSAMDGRMTTNTNVACASCHPDAREDGHVWNFPEGPRQTPSLAGRSVTQTAPYHWNGEFGSIDDFLAHTVSLRMGGTGVTPAMAAQLAAYMDVAPGADNPHRLPAPTAAQLRGRAVFVNAGCETCHAGTTFTNNTFADVGTLVLDGAVRDDVSRLPDGLNTPSLLGVSRTAPYLHDGSAPSLKDRLMRDRERDLHGNTSDLAESDIDALVEYLKTL